MSRTSRWLSAFVMLAESSSLNAGDDVRGDSGIFESCGSVGVEKRRGGEGMGSEEWRVQ